MTQRERREGQRQVPTLLVVGVVALLLLGAVLWWGWRLRDPTTPLAVAPIPTQASTLPVSVTPTLPSWVETSGPPSSPHQTTDSSTPTSTSSPTPPTGHLSTSSSAPAARVLGCRSALSVNEKVAQGGSLPAQCTSTGWHYVIPAAPNPVTPRRVETVWAMNGKPVVFHEGDTVHFRATFTGQLGAAAQDDNNWHVMWQLHGISTDGVWRSPLLGINVRHGQLRLGGGAGHPNHSYDPLSRNYEWSRDLAAYADGRTYDVAVTIFLSTNPDQGWIDAWVNGRKVLTHWHPISPQGNRPGTFYPNQPEIASRNGLYRGTQNNAPIPTYQQSMRIEMISPG